MIGGRPILLKQMACFSLLHSGATSGLKSRTDPPLSLKYHKTRVVSLSGQHWSECGVVHRRQAPLYTTKPAKEMEKEALIQNATTEMKPEG